MKCPFLKLLAEGDFEGGVGLDYLLPSAFCRAALHAQCHALKEMPSMAVLGDKVSGITLLPHANQNISLNPFPQIQKQ